MAEPLKNYYGIDVVHKIGAMIEFAYPKFAKQAFILDVQKGYSALELMDRGKKIAAGLQRFLPVDFQTSVDILLASLDAPLALDEENSIGSFIFLPHTIYVSENGLDDFKTSMQALYLLTQRFTSEFAIRPFIQKYPDETFALLTTWATDANLHVRRLVSEGTRPRLPWASRLPQFIEDPSPVISLLEKLKDDPELYVRRSVSNNLNDIGKDHPKLLADIAKQWLNSATKERRWLVKHALRSAIKRGEQGALEALGYGQHVDIKIVNIAILPKIAKVGESVQICFELHNKAESEVALMVDLSIYFVKANGDSNAKVFKLKAVELKPDESCTFSKKISLKPMTTRTLYAGVHKVEALINGKTFPLGEFTLLVK